MSIISIINSIFLAMITCGQFRGKVKGRASLIMDMKAQ